MRGTTLANLRTRLKAEVGDAQETNTFADQEYMYLLSTKQQDLANAFDWAFLEHRWDLACAAGSRYLTLPTQDIQGLTVTPNFERPMLVERYYNIKYVPIAYGIGAQQYNWIDSNLGQTLDPIQNWRMASNVSEASNPSQIEIWPIPQTNQVIRFTGQRQVLTLSADADKADLDDLLLIYMVAAERLMLRDQKSAQFKLNQAQQHLIKLRAGYPTNNDPIKLGGATYETRGIRTTPLVVVHG